MDLTGSKNSGKKPSERQMVDSTSNQWISNPKQLLALELWLDPTSKSFGNMYKSAKQAGYSDSYARKVSSPSVKNMWLSEFVEQLSDFTPQHVEQGVTHIATHAIRDSDKLRAYELLAKLKGYLVERQVVGHVSLEQMIDSLK